MILNAEKVAKARPLRDLFDRYAREVSPTKRGARWEILRLERLKKDKLAKIQLDQMDETHFADWRDRRLKEISPGSVVREMHLLSALLNLALAEWRVIDSNPLKNVRRPAEPPPRNRLPTDEEMERPAHVAGDDLTKSTARAFHAFKFACATAMRAGEIVGLTWEHIDLDVRVAYLPKTKNGYVREVPMSSAAVAILEALPKSDPVFNLKSAQLDALWRKIRDKAGVEGLTFHDSRAKALTDLSRRVDVLTLAKISGHRDIKLLSNVYYREDAASIAQRLD